MTIDLARILDGFDGLRATVVGDAILDRYTFGRADRVCREAPALAVDMLAEVDFPGGAANAAVNVRALGAEPLLLSVLGVDEEADDLIALMGERGVPARFLRDGSRRTPLRHRVLSDGHMLLRLDRGGAPPSTELPEKLEAELAGQLEAELSRSDVLIVSDSGLGTITPRVVAAIASLRDRGPATVVVDSWDASAFGALRPTAVTPNYAEAARALEGGEHGGRRRVQGSRIDHLRSSGAEILTRTGARVVAITLDAEGALVFQQNKAPVHTLARGGKAVSSVGAGDTFAVTLALALASGADPSVATELACAAAGAAVATSGTAVCDAVELRRRLIGADKIGDRLSLARLRARADKEHLRLVFTNGCYDILHEGHVSLLRRAKELGDVVVVGVNSDDSVGRLKGSGRPVNTLAERLRLLAALSCVDLVVPFDGDQPTDLITALRPDDYVKGADYTRETLPEVALVEHLGGVVHLLDLVPDQSTSNILKRLESSGRPSTGE